MGRFATTVEFYARYREPYSPQFFSKVAHDLRFIGTEHLLDIGCGPGLLTFGFAPFVADATGIDPEAAMLNAARAAVGQRPNIVFLHSRLEDFTPGHRFEMITIGRALHWLDRPAALAKLDQLLAPAGRILICGASSLPGENSPWVQAYNDARHLWVAEDETRYRTTGADWFAGSQFQELETISVTELHEVTVDHLIGRALSKSNTSPEKLGERRPDFEAEIRKTLEPFSHDRPLHEQVVSRATVFGRHTAE